MHKEYEHIVPSSPVGILFIHGIAGTPNHFRQWIQLLPKTISVHNLLLEGHGKGVRDFSKASMEKWKRQVSLAVEEMAQSHRDVYVVAHSMGTLLAIEEAIKGNKISRLYLLAVPLRILPKPQMFLTSLKIFFGRIDPEDLLAVAAKECYGIAPDKNPFHYLGWIPRYMELFLQIRKTRKHIQKLTIPTLVFQSRKDEMVSLRSNQYLEKNPHITLAVLEHSCHYYYDTQDFAFLQKAFLQFIS